MLRLIPCVVGLIAGVHLTACHGVKGYDGHLRPDSEVARIHVNPADAEIGFLVTGVDGVALQAEGDLDLLPGNHAVDLELTPTSEQQYSLMDPAQAGVAQTHDHEHRRTAALSVSVEAGRTYGLRGMYNAGIYDYWLYDTESNAIVARGSTR